MVCSVVDCSVTVVCSVVGSSVTVVGSSVSSSVVVSSVISSSVVVSIGSSVVVTGTSVVVVSGGVSVSVTSVTISVVVGGSVVVETFVYEPHEYSHYKRMGKLLKLKDKLSLLYSSLTSHGSTQTCLFSLKYIIGGHDIITGLYVPDWDIVQI